MIICIDFDSTLVDEWGRKFADVTTPLKLMGGARKALQAMKAAGHVVLVSSARANRALRIDPELDPLVRSGVVKLDRAAWEAEQPLHEARCQQMVQFCATTLKGLVDAVDDGGQGKPVADVYIDDRALRFGGGVDGHNWFDIARQFGA
ncbi:MAG: hypothetical protein RL199_2320 [Pseudomonadota bacterium]